MITHAPLPPDLALPPRFRHVQGYLTTVDRDLRLRRSAERPWLYVLERRCRRAPAVNAGMRFRSDMHVQAAQGYIHVSTVHPQLLERPWTIVQVLQTEGVDLWAARGWASAADTVDAEARYEEQWARETRTRRRRDLFRNIALDHYDLMARREGHRVSNAGAPAAS